MKKIVISLVVGLSVLSTSLLYAAEVVKIGVVDVDKVIQQSNEGKKASAELDALVKAKQAAMTEKSANLEKMKKALDAETDASAKAKKQTEFNQASSEYQTFAAGAQSEVQKKAGDLREGILKDVKKILTTIGSDEKFTAIFTTATVPYYQKTIEITAKVIKIYDESKKGK
jgi:outer membrane protein